MPVRNVPDLLGLTAYSVDWQHLVCLLYTLREMGAGGHRRQEVCEFIQRKHYLALVPDDIAPYPTQSEPSWQTDIAYARKIGVIMGIIGYSERDSWEYVRQGREQLDVILSAGERGEIAGSKCFLWSREFRRVFDPDYEPSAADTLRPPKQHRIGADKDFVQSARKFVATGRGNEAATALSKHLGFHVTPDVKSIALALQVRADRLTAELLS